MSLAIDDSLAVELRDARDCLAGGRLRCVEVYDLGGGVLEWQDDGVGWEDGEVVVELL